jgi:Zn-dependent peptidase ImmA (M78 family)
MGNLDPIRSMRDLVEKDLGIPVVQAQLQPSIAGATITTKGFNGGEVRGFVLNTIGDNSNVWVRRATLAHELGHILHDPSQELKELRVDSYTGTLANPELGSGDYVEQRANAFAIAFLAPLESVRNMTPTPIGAEAVGEVMQTFGISHTAARYHVFNAHHRQDQLPNQTELPGPAEEWLTAEDFTLDYFPVRSVPFQRRGRFAGLVAECFQRRLLSSYTAALYLGCSEDEFMENVVAIQQFHPMEDA